MCTPTTQYYTLVVQIGQRLYRAFRIITHSEITIQYILTCITIHGFIFSSNIDMKIFSVFLFSLSAMANFNHLSQKMFKKHHRGSRIRIRSSQLLEFDALSWIVNNHSTMKSQLSTSPSQAMYNQYFSKYVAKLGRQ